MKHSNSPLRAGFAFTAITAIALSTVACSDDGGSSPDAGSGGDATETVSVGVITALSGSLGLYGETWLDGFTAGLDYVTDGTNVIDGKLIEVSEPYDDQGTPATAVTGATQLVGDGASIIVGGGGSSSSLQLATFAEENSMLYIAGFAATDALTGINRNTFRSARQSYQDLAAAASLLDDPQNSEVAIFAQDNEFGSSQVTSGTEVFEGAGATVTPILVDADTTELAPPAAEIAGSGADMMFTNWSGTTVAAMWEALSQQKVFDALDVVTPVTDRGAWPAYGNAAANIQFVSQAPLGSSDFAQDQQLFEEYPAGDPYTQNGWVTALLLAQAVSGGEAGDVDSQIAALEDFTFESPTGEMAVRAEDHALLQDMFILQLDDSSGSYEVSLVDTVPADDIVPPAVSNW